MAARHEGPAGRPAAGKRGRPGPPGARPLSGATLADATRLLQSKNYQLARALLRRLRAARPDDVEAMYLEAWCAWEGFQDAATALPLLVRLRDRAPGNRKIRGHILEIRRAEGDREAIVAAAEDLLACAPGDAIALSSLEQALRPTLGDPLAGRLREALEAPGLSPRQARRLHHAVARIADRSGDYAGAFAALERAKGLIEARFDFEATRRHVAEIRNLFTEAFLAERDRLGVSDRRPVFILGMPRTGGTLLERCLAAHPKIGAAGEPGLIDLANAKLRHASGAAAPEAPLFAHLASPSKARLRAAASAVLERLASLSSRRNAPRILDKTPPNLFFVGLIRIAFPQAVVIRTRRDPRDTLLSCYFQNFQGLEWSRSLEEMATYHELVEETLAHWSAVCGEAVSTIAYEDLVSAPEPQLRRLLAAIGLDWSDACLRHERSEGVVRNASQFQVRDPLHTRSVGRWRRYARELAPLLERLERGPIRPLDAA